jgi:hypothetical protein
MNIDMPWYALASVSVTAMSRMRSACSAPEEKNLSPLMTHSSPSRIARQRKPVGSDPPCGSVIE